MKEKRPLVVGAAVASGSSPSLTCGVSLQVMKVDLLDGDQVTFEDSGRGDGGVLANETILMRGLVVRSRSNQIRLRLRSRRPQPGSVLLRYQGGSGGGEGGGACVLVAVLKQLWWDCWGLSAGLRLL